MLGIAIGVAAVILLTSIGEGTRVYMVSQFTQFGTNILAINPGKSKTIGIPGVLGGTTRKLTIDDAEALARVPGIETVVPVVKGLARVEAAERGRSVTVLGATPDLPTLWRFGARQGSFWPRGDPRRGAPLAVLGPKLARELFGERSPLGEFVRIAGARFRVVGVMQPKGQMSSLSTTIPFRLENSHKGERAREGTGRSAEWVLGFARTGTDSASHCHLSVPRRSSRHEAPYLAACLCTQR